MPTEFDALKGLAAWRTKLDQLLAAARETAQKDDLSGPSGHGRPPDPVHHPQPAGSPLADPASAEYEEMDRIAPPVPRCPAVGAPSRSAWPKS